MSPLNLIPEQYQLIAKAVVIAILAAVLFAAGWTVKGWKDDGAYQLLLTQQAEAANKQLQDVIADRDAKQKAIADIDQRNYQEMTNAQAQIADLRKRIASGRVRLTVPARCSQNSGTSVDHGEARTELDPALSDSLIAITADGDQAIRQLTACQEILRL